ncbi:unnamed protein product [Adineta ricciae]|uniref:Uncharacterized protein n=1 Tax=Adineta ricciae TaxID=249248 RepID=A0A815JC18_ADIRI|nr:unnamed protein product [Adineta ricciae]CAF1374734.1 unnamed protein product [Adineta ricciae]
MISTKIVLYGNIIKKTKQNYVSYRAIDLGNGIIIEFSASKLRNDVQNPKKLKSDHSDDYFLVCQVIKIYHLPKHNSFVENLANQFKEMTVFTARTCTLRMVCRNASGYYTNEITIQKPLITNLMLFTMLNTNDSEGIVLLRGVPGSSRTNYIRYLIHEIQDKTLIYIPPDMAKEISSPEFLPFFMEYENAILISEDAENIIRDRSGTTVSSPQAVANLLNLSDGLLGDAMHQQIIATFNCDLTIVDRALLRKGRLIANYEFNRLDIES